ncbi:MAG TPA: CRTAC1 family protein [Patescibacteria group bacterium]|nr:CRTAC1 family protein [Patescibacteria group bacterium]
MTDGPASRLPVRLAAVVLLVVAAMAVVAVAAAIGLVRPPGTAGPVPRFLDVTAGSGVAFTYDGPVELSVGAGVAVLDCDADGYPDLYLAGGANPAGLFHNTAATGGEVRFEHIEDPATDLTSVTGAYPIDVDGDGIVDLAVLRTNGNVLLRGLGDCRFEPANSAWGLQGGTRHTMAFSATWEAGSSWPTIAFGNYVDDTIDDPRRWCEPNQLVRPASPSARAWGTPQDLPGWCTLSLLFSSWDRSGRADLRVSNDRHYYPQDVGQEQLWRMEAGAPPRLYTASDGWNEVQVEGMGIASYDLTGDGLPEVYLTSQAANHLMTLADGPAKPTYRDIGLARGTNVPHPLVGDTAFASTAWHPEFADVNNDGLIDLFVSKGNVSQQPDYAKRDPSNLLVGQPDGTFAESTEAAGLISFDRARGAALVDLNLDGRLDLVESFYGAASRIWRNDGPGDGSSPAAHWLALRVREPGPNADAIGGTIEVSTSSGTYRRELTIGGGHAGGQLGWLHFGIGSADKAQVVVRWPDGTSSNAVTIPADGFTIVDRTTGAQPWLPGGAP